MNAVLPARVVSLTLAANDFTWFLLNFQQRHLISCGEILLPKFQRSDPHSISSAVLELLDEIPHADLYVKFSSEGSRMNRVSVPASQIPTMLHNLRVEAAVYSALYSRSRRLERPLKLLAVKPQFVFQPLKLWMAGNQLASLDLVRQLILKLELPSSDFKPGLYECSRSDQLSQSESSSSMMYRVSREYSRLLDGWTADEDVVEKLSNRIGVDNQELVARNLLMGVMVPHLLKKQKIAVKSHEDKSRDVLPCHTPSLLSHNDGDCIESNSLGLLAN